LIGLRTAPPVLVAASQHEPTILCAQLGSIYAPLVAARIEVAHAAAGYHQVELPLPDVANVRRHDDHGLPGKPLRAHVHTAFIAGGPCKLELKASPTPHAVDGRESIRNEVAVSPRRIAVASECTASRASVGCGVCANIVIPHPARCDSPTVLGPATG